mgnify:CR=1 FL=1
MTAPRRKLIEVALPLEAINKAAGVIFFFERRAHFRPGGRQLHAGSGAGSGSIGNSFPDPRPLTPASRGGSLEHVSADSRLRVGVVRFKGGVRSARQTASLRKAGYGWE